ncbi:GGDEF domain-containing protein [Thalassotalea sp. G2M2-11]|uniref:GGDEF domain-containing protein n=1 Tax=Thalassotalea sp. G2M2-11 TaxID=2787627 RepID=UPI0019D0D47F|nr:GGDEF domain-containing protein [Thalassotalea sp. G2M2-11]
MQTLNLVENTAIDFNAFKVIDTQDHQETSCRLALMEQLQTSLDVNVLLNIFAMEVAKYVEFSGLYFKSVNISAAVRGSKSARKERRYELKINHQYIGTLTYALNSPISITNHKIIKKLHQLLVYPLNNAIKYQQAMQLAMQDALTGLSNRRYFDQQIKRAMHHANRQHTKVGIIVCDLNKFKEVNDCYGHSVGDQVLLKFARALETSVRDSDSIFRFGGDEFAILVEDASEDSLNIIEARINHAVGQCSLLSKYGVGFSLGKTFMNRADNEQSFFERADQLLYKNKLQHHNTLNIV